MAGRGGFEIEFAALGGPGDEMLGFELREQLPALNINSAVTLQNVEAVFKGSAVHFHAPARNDFAALHDVLPIGLKYDPQGGRHRRSAAGALLGSGGFEFLNGGGWKEHCGIMSTIDRFITKPG